ncbi:MAG: hypothetical protein QOD56_2667, partial [Gammaproteobacteria bacterium]|nr:hypothetical protein [Gammaproteobacteria bacterium]
MHVRVRVPQAALMLVRMTVRDNLHSIAFFNM